MSKLAARREAIERTGRVRELVFGMQDGAMSTLGLLAGLSGATERRTLVLLAGMTAILSGAISMAAGSYLSGRAETDILDAEVKDAEKLAGSEPYLAQEGVLEALVRDGLSREQAYRVVRLLSSDHRVLLSTFNEKVFGLGRAELTQPMKGAVVMALSFIAGGTVPLLPYGMPSLPVHVALATSVLLGAALMFAVGAFKGRLAQQPVGRSGLAFCIVAIGSGLAGFAIGLLVDRIAPGTAAAAATAG